MYSVRFHNRGIMPAEILAMREPVMFAHPLLLKKLFWRRKVEKIIGFRLSRSFVVKDQGWVTAMDDIERIIIIETEIKFDPFESLVRWPVFPKIGANDMNFRFDTASKDLYTNDFFYTGEFS